MPKVVNPKTNIESFIMDDCVKNAVRCYWPRSANPHQALREHRILSAEIIRCKYEEMDPETKARAWKTLRHLESDCAEPWSIYVT